MFAERDLDPDAFAFQLGDVADLGFCEQFIAADMYAPENRNGAAGIDRLHDFRGEFQRKIRLAAPDLLGE